VRLTSRVLTNKSQSLPCWGSLFLVLESSSDSKLSSEVSKNISFGIVEFGKCLYFTIKELSGYGTGVTLNIFTSSQNKYGWKKYVSYFSLNRFPNMF